MSPDFKTCKLEIVRMAGCECICQTKLHTAVAVDMRHCVLILYIGTLVPCKVAIRKTLQLCTIVPPPACVVELLFSLDLLVVI